MSALWGEGAGGGSVRIPALVILLAKTEQFSCRDYLLDTYKCAISPPWNKLALTSYQFPAYPNSSLESVSCQYPLVIFSHGLAGTRTAYSQYCSAIASEGYVVLAVEHHDGSGPSVSLPPEEGSTEPRFVQYIRHAELE